MPVFRVGRCGACFQGEEMWCLFLGWGDVLPVRGNK